MIERWSDGSGCLRCRLAWYTVLLTFVFTLVDEYSLLMWNLTIFYYSKVSFFVIFGGK